MGGYAITASFKRVAGRPERSPRWIRDELWHKVDLRIRFALIGKEPALKPYRAVHDSPEWFMDQRRRWKAKEGELLFVFGDSAGMCHVTAAAWAHWVSTVLARFAKTR